MEPTSDVTYFKDGSRPNQGMQASASATMLPPVSMYHEAQVEEGSMSPPPPALIWLTPGGDRKEQLRNLLEYSEDILGEFALSPQHSRSWAGEEKFKKPRDPFSKPPTTDGRRISIGLNRVRPSTPIDDSVKRLNLNRLHTFHYASTLEDEVKRLNLNRLHTFHYASTLEDEVKDVEKRTIDAVNKEISEREARKAFKADILHKTREAARIADELHNANTGSNALKKAQMLVSGFARARAAQSPTRKRFVLPQPAEP